MTYETSTQPLAIEIKDLVKDFRVYHRSYGTLKGMASDWFRSSLLRQAVKGYELRRALDHVTLSIPQGQTTALIGRNGSGKSTLLAILSRIYLPTSGEAVLRGSLMSLLELGVGFDDELTGAENVFFGAMVRGLSSEEAAARYNDIVEFSELGQETMDLPVRMYSSGMKLRLAFGIVGNLDSNIILLDEGLAVGDIAFQHKCLDRLTEFKAQGRTIVMVAHEMPLVHQFAERVIWLERGAIKMDGPPDVVVPAYEAMLLDATDAAKA
ncbi:MAG TPA: ABC transporter ATP-binding protein [Capsulimonadaceae bacterium]